MTYPHSSPFAGHSSQFLAAMQQQSYQDELRRQVNAVRGSTPVTIQSSKTLPKQESKPMKEGFMFSIYKDFKDFAREHKGVIYTILFLIVLDKYIFDGAFRDRLKKLVGGLMDKTEKLVEKA